MGAWKLVVYPFGLAIAGVLLVDVIGILAFGADSRVWLEWQNKAVTAVGVGAGVIGAMVGVYVAIRSHARLLP